MRLRTALCLATILGLCLSVAAWSTPITVRTASARLSTHERLCLGKIPTIADAAFSLGFTKGQERKVLEFSIDGDTKVEGKLEVGSQAKAGYRYADGKNVAVHVVVTPTSGMSAR
jgi:hypothetical protein